MKRIAFLFLLSLFILTQVFAQTLSVSPLSASATTTRTANYTVPVGGTCAASGVWSATKTESGTDTFSAGAGPVIWTCTGSTATATLNWSPVTANTDGSALTGHRYEFWSQVGTATKWIGAVNHPTVTKQFSGLPTGNVCFIARTTVGTAPSVVSSDNSNQVCKVLTGDITTANVQLLVTEPPKPLPPVLLTVNNVAMSTVPNYDRSAFVASKVVGSVNLGVVCDETRQIADGYARIPLSFVQWSVSPSQRPGYVVAECSR